MHLCWRPAGPPSAMEVETIGSDGKADFTREMLVSTVQIVNVFFCIACFRSKMKSITANIVVGCAELHIFPKVSGVPGLVLLALFSA